LKYATDREDYADLAERGGVDHGGRKLLLGQSGVLGVHAAAATTRRAARASTQSASCRSVRARRNGRSGPRAARRLARPTRGRRDALGVVRRAGPSPRSEKSFDQDFVAGSRWRAGVGDRG